MTKTVIDSLNDYEKHVYTTLRDLQDSVKQVIVYRERNGSMVGCDKEFELDGDCIKLKMHPTSVCKIAQVVRMQLGFVDSILTLWVD